MNPLVSFVVTYHNEPEALLRACLQSIVALRFARDEAEVIVVDDGSDVPLDASSPLFASFQKQGEGGDKPRLRIVRQANSGLSVARNAGIDASEGTYIQFVDADDCLIPAAYESVLGLVRREDSDVVMFQMTKEMLPLQQPHGPLSKPLPRGGEASAAGLLPLGGGREGAERFREASGSDFLLHRNLRAAAWGYVFRREILGDLRFRPGLLHEDELFTPLLFLRAKALLEVDAKAYFYRQHSGTITHSTSPEQVLRRLDDILFTIRTLNDAGEPVLERRVRQLTVDYIQKTLTLTHSLRELRRRTRQLCEEGLLPLPVRRYSMRYFLFSLVF